MQKVVSARMLRALFVLCAALAVAGCSGHTDEARPPIAASPARDAIRVGALSESMEPVEVNVTCSGLTHIKNLPSEPTPESIPLTPIAVIREDSTEEEVELSDGATAPDGYALVSASLRIENGNDTAATFDVSQPKFYLPKDGTSSLGLVGTIDPLMRTSWNGSGEDDKSYWQVEVPPHGSVEIEVIHLLPSEALRDPHLLFAVTRGQGSEDGASGLQGYRAEELIR